MQNPSSCDFYDICHGFLSDRKSSSPECARYLILRRRYDHDAGLGYGIAGGAVGIGVKSDGAGFGNSSSRVDNNAAEAAVAADFHAGHQNGILYFAIAV